MDIPQIEFREAVLGEPILSQPVADGRLHEDGPDLDDQGLMFCPACEGDGIETVPGVYPKQARPCSRCLGDGVVEKDG